MKGGAEHGSNVLSRVRSALRTARGSPTSWYFALFALTPAICPQTRETRSFCHRALPLLLVKTSAKVSLRGGCQSLSKRKEKAPAAPRP